MKSLIKELAEYKENALVLIVAVYLYGVYKTKLFYKARKLPFPLYIYDFFKKGQYAGEEFRQITLIDYIGAEYGYDTLFYGLLNELQADGTSIDDMNSSLDEIFMPKKLRNEILKWLEQYENEMAV